MPVYIASRILELDQEELIEILKELRDEEPDAYNKLRELIEQA